jgi:hypothetical protein
MLKYLKIIKGAKMKEEKPRYQRASFRFDYDTYNEFRKICKEEGFKQSSLLDRLMRDFIKKIKEDNQNDR